MALWTTPQRALRIDAQHGLVDLAADLVLVIPIDVAICNGTLSLTKTVGSRVVAGHVF